MKPTVLNLRKRRVKEVIKALYLVLLSGYSQLTLVFAYVQMGEPCFTDGIAIN